MSWMETGPPYSERTQTCLSFFSLYRIQKRKSFLSGQLACWFANPDCSASDVQSTSRPTWRLHSRALTAPHVTTWHVGGGLSVRDVLQSSIAAADAARATVAVASRRHKQLDKGRCRRGALSRTVSRLLLVLVCTPNCFGQMASGGVNASCARGPGLPCGQADWPWTVVVLDCPHWFP
jgi:hypothetical protein